MTAHIVDLFKKKNGDAGVSVTPERIQWGCDTGFQVD